MNKAKNNMYGFVDYTHNPIKGLCQHDCVYCYMKSFRERYLLDETLRLVPAELKAGLGQGRTIFIGSSTDAFAANVPAEWIIETLDQLNRYTGNTYLLQSKNPARFLGFLDHPVFTNPDNIIFCTTLESDIDHPNVSSAPTMDERVKAMQELSAKGFKTMVTVEPVMKFSSSKVFSDLLMSIHPIQVNIGANSIPAIHLPEPTKDEVLELIAELKANGMTVHEKPNLDRIIK